MSKHYMIGTDMSHYQDDATFNQYLGERPGFMILKASEGKTWTDKTFKDRAAKVQSRGVLLGAYHYARPENGNSVDDELNNFRKMIGDFRVRPFLDIEGAAINCVNWCREWLIKANKIWPNVGMYCSLSPAQSKLKSLCDEFPVWIAHYTSACGVAGCSHFNGEIITQYTNNPIDLDIAVSMDAGEWYGDNVKNEYTDCVCITENERKLVEFVRQYGFR